MVFNYKWTNKENGNFAIRRKDAKGREAGKAIEVKNSKQTADTHFFLFVDEKDTESSFNLYGKINPILKTITYEYMYRGTDKKSLTRYLTKKDIENVLTNIEEYKNKTIRIETSFSKLTGTEKSKQEKITANKWKKLLIKVYEEGFYEKLLKLLKNNIVKDNMLKEKQQQAETEIKRIKKEMLELEKATNADKAKVEKYTFNTLKEKIKDLSYTDNGELLNFPNLLEELYNIAKNDIKRINTNKIQKRYREKKNTESGKTKKV